MASDVNTPADSPDTASGTSLVTIIACNSISIAACVLTLSLYFTLFFHRKYKRLMRRTSLVLAACMASSDLLLHCSNIAGYEPLPTKWSCAIIGGAFFAGPTALTTFYSCCIALNSQLAFVFHRRPSTRALRYYIIIPFLVCIIIYGTTLGTGSFGYDETWGYCWYATEGVPPSLVLIRIVLTYCLPTLLCIFYLFIATIAISIAVFGRKSNIHGLPTAGYGLDERTTSSPSKSPRQSDHTSSRAARPSAISVRKELQSPASPTSVNASSISEQHVFPPSSFSPLLSKSPREFWAFSSPFSSKQKIASPDDDDHHHNTRPTTNIRSKLEERKMSRRALVLRQLTIRLIGYIVTPILCLLPGIILDLLTKAMPDLRVPAWLNGLFDGLNGLVGLFNSILMLSDPSLLAVWDDLRLTLRNAKCACARQCDARCQGSSAFLKRWRRGGDGGGGGGGDGDAEGGVKGVGKRDGNRTRKDGGGGGGDGGGIQAHMMEDSLMSGFARTRMDDLEANMEEPDQPVNPPPARERGKRKEEEEEEESIEMEEKEVTVREEQGKRRQVDVGDRRPLEVRVTVDVVQTTRQRRLSRVEMMENWLAGL